MTRRGKEIDRFRPDPNPLAKFTISQLRQMWDEADDNPATGATKEGFAQGAIASELDRRNKVDESRAIRKARPNLLPGAIDPDITPTRPSRIVEADRLVDQDQKAQ